MTANDVAAFIKLSLTSVRRLTMNKQIPSYKINRSVRYKLDEIETWLESRKQAVVADTAKINDAQKCARTGEGVNEINVTGHTPQKMLNEEKGKRGGNV